MTIIFRDPLSIDTFSKELDITLPAIGDIIEGCEVVETGEKIVIMFKTS